MLDRAIADLDDQIYLKMREVAGLQAGREALVQQQEQHRKLRTPAPKPTAAATK